MDEPTTARLTKPRRRELILQQLRVAPALRVHELAERFSVTTETIRRDLDELHQSGQLSRTYGGAAPLSGHSEPALDERTLLMVRERTAIAAAAARSVEAGDFVMMDVGSTNLHCARFLAAGALKLRVLTNCVRIAAALATNPSIDVVLAPGEYDARNGMTFGPDAIEYTRRFRANKLILSATGLDADGASDADRTLVGIKRAMVQSADRVHLMIDHSKFGIRSVETFLRLGEIDTLFVDRLPEARLSRALRQARVVVVEVETTRLRNDRTRSSD